MVHIDWDYGRAKPQDQALFLPPHLLLPDRISRMADRVLCDLCDRPMPPHASYVVRMDVFADPSMPPLNTEDLEETNFNETFDKLMEEMKGMTADDLQDGVHRRFEYRLCPSCHRRFLANPLGKPRDWRAGKN
jgi:hypothetical protein